MGAAKIFKPDNRLAKAAQSSRGALAADLILEANARVAELDDEVRAFVAIELKKLAACAALDNTALLAQSAALGDAAVHIAEVAGAAGMTAIGEVARGVCAMVEGLAETGAWHAGAVRVHLQSLALVKSGPDDQSPENQLILDNLATMRRALGVSE